MSMFHNPFNSKVVSDITRFLEEHKDDITIHPCLDEAARQAAEQIGDEPILEDRRKAMRERFNDAVTDCGCRGTTKESNEFAKAVERYIEEKRKLPPEFLKNIQKKKDAAKKGGDAKEEVEEESFDSLTEAAKKRKPYEEVYYKWFDRVSVDIMDMTKIAKEIQAALDSKADLEKVMPELVKKYRKG